MYLYNSIYNYNIIYLYIYTYNHIHIIIYIYVYVYMYIYCFQVLGKTKHLRPRNFQQSRRIFGAF